MIDIRLILFRFQMKYFDDAVVHCMQTMNALEFQDFGQKREFFTILSQTIPLFPRVGIRLSDVSSNQASMQRFQCSLDYKFIF